MRSTRQPGRWRQPLTVLAAASALLIGPASAASAGSAPEGGANETAALVSDAAPDPGEILEPAPVPGGLVATGELAEVTLPTDSDAPIGLEDRAAGPAGAGLELSLPSEVDTSAAVVADDGTVVYAGESATDLAVQALDGGVRVQMILADATAPTEYTFDLGDDILPVLETDGSVSLQVPSAELAGLDSTVQAGSIATPWATDANGVAVPTSFRVEGHTVVQTVAHTGAQVAYPVVADPSVSVGWRVYVRYSAAETKAQTVGWRGTINDKAKYAAILCAPIWAYSSVGSAACAYAVYDGSSSIMATARSAAAQGRGMEVQYIYWPGIVPVSWFVR